VTYRPRPNVIALARQYFRTGRWRRVVAREHRGTVNLRYLAPPVAVLAMTAGAAAGIFGLPWGWLLPGGYAAALVVGAGLTGRGLPLSALLRLPVVYAAMHVAWGIGFLTSPPGLGRRRPLEPSSQTPL
jgi:hypothetical protein